MVQWVRLWASNAGGTVLSLIGELGSHLQHCVAKIITIIIIIWYYRYKKMHKTFVYGFKNNYNANSHLITAQVEMWTIAGIPEASISWSHPLPYLSYPQGITILIFMMKMSSFFFTFLPLKCESVQNIFYLSFKELHVSRIIVFTLFVTCSLCSVLFLWNSSVLVMQLWFVFLIVGNFIICPCKNLILL